MNENYCTLVINEGDVSIYRSCADEEYNADYLNGIGFSWETAIEIAAWATYAPEDSEYEQDELPGIRIYII